jgi:prophage regulatory protein
MKIIRVPQVSALTGLSRSSIYRLESEGSFPRRKQLGKRMTGWIDEDVIHWLENLPNGGCVTPTHATSAR